MIASLRLSTPSLTPTMSPSPSTMPMEAPGRVISQHLLPDGTGGLQSVSYSNTLAVQEFGAAVASAGDLNGDGTVDFIVGAPADVEGSLYVLLTDGNRRNGALASTVILQDSAFGFSKDSFSLERGDRAFAAVTSLGDLDGDGVPDAVAGAPKLDGKDQCSVFSACADNGGLFIIKFTAQGWAK